VLQLFVSDDAEGERPRIDRPARGVFGEREVIREAACEACEQDWARHARGRGEQVVRHALFERRREHRDLAAVLAEVVSQQSFAAPPVFDD
jgi:hypothetical protein